MKMTPRKAMKRRPHASWNVWDNQSWQGENEDVSSKHTIPVCVPPLSCHPQIESWRFHKCLKLFSFCLDYIETDKQVKSDPTWLFSPQSLSFSRISSGLPSFVVMLGHLWQLCVVFSLADPCGHLTQYDQSFFLPQMCCQQTFLVPDFFFQFRESRNWLLFGLVLSLLPTCFRFQDYSLCVIEGHMSIAGMLNTHREKERNKLYLWG